MKFIGQHIVDLIARFRSDVYLEDVSSGTIASGANLGLDSNNKLVKASVSGGTDTNTTYSVSCVDGDNSDEEKIRLTDSSGGTDDVVLEAGTGLSIARSSDKITFTNTVSDTNTQLSNEQVQDIVGGMVTGNTESGITVTYQDADGTLDFSVGTLNQDTTGNAATATALANAREISGVEFDGTGNITLNNNQITNGAGYTTNTGDITGVAAGTNLSGGGTSGDVTINLADASTSAKGAASFSSDNFSVSSGAVTIKDEGVDLTAEVTGVLPTANQKHIMHFQFMGYSIGDGSNYEMPQPLTDGQAPFEHADTSSADGLTIPAGSGTNVSEMIRMGGHVMVRAGTLKKWKGWASCNHNGGNYFVALFKWSPVENDNTDISASHGGLTMLDEATIVGKTNDKVMPIDETSFTSASVAAGDIIFTQVKTTSASKTVYFNTTLEIEM